MIKKLGMMKLLVTICVGSQVTAVHGSDDSTDDPIGEFIGRVGEFMIEEVSLELMREAENIPNNSIVMTLEGIVEAVNQGKPINAIREASTFVAYHAGNKGKFDHDVEEVANGIEQAFYSVGETLFSHLDNTPEQSALPPNIQQITPNIQDVTPAPLPDLANFLREINPDLAAKYEPISKQEKQVNPGLLNETTIQAPKQPMYPGLKVKTEHDINSNLAAKYEPASKQEKQVNPGLVNETTIQAPKQPMYPEPKVKTESDKKSSQKPINARVKGSYAPKNIPESAQVYSNNKAYGLGLTNTGLKELISIAARNPSLGDVLGSENQSLKTKIDTMRQELSNSVKYVSKTVPEICEEMRISEEMSKNKQSKIGLRVTHKERDELIMMAVTCPSLESFLVSQDPSLQKQINEQKD